MGLFGISYNKFLPTQYVIVYKNGKEIKAGPGLSFFYNSNNTSMAVIPIASMDANFAYDEITSDFQTVSIQGQVTYRIIDYRTTAKLIDFTAKEKGVAAASALTKLQKRIIDLVHVLVKKHIEGMEVRTAIQSNEVLANAVKIELKKREELATLGLEIIGFSILSISPTKETSRALEAKTREEILKQADDAIYIRRNAAIEQERKVKENELNTEISVAAKQKEKKSMELQTKRLVMERESEIKQLELEKQIELEKKNKELVELKILNKKKEADAKAYEVSTMMNAFAQTKPEVLNALSSVGMSPDKLIAVAFQQLAGNADKIGTLNITPDLLEKIMDK